MYDHPALVFAVSFLVLSLTAWAGSSLSKRRELEKEARDDFALVVAATLTLLGLVIGFTFSMATGRYDQRKNFEEAEANAIGTEFVRADLLPPAVAETTRALLGKYLDQRVSFYGARDAQQLRAINDRTAQLQNDLWSAVKTPAMAQPSPVIALAVSGMNDVLNSRGYTQAAWWNRIPRAAWYLMTSIAIFCNLLIGYQVRHVERKGVMLMILPLVVSTAFLLIADIDSPRGGLIHVTPVNLLTLSASISVH